MEIFPNSPHISRFYPFLVVSPSKGFPMPPSTHYYKKAKSRPTRLFPFSKIYFLNPLTVIRFWFSKFQIRWWAIIQSKLSNEHSPSAIQPIWPNCAIASWYSKTLLEKEIPNGHQFPILMHFTSGRLFRVCWYTWPHRKKCPMATSFRSWRISHVAGFFSPCGLIDLLSGSPTVCGGVPTNITHTK